MFAPEASRTLTEISARSPRTIVPWSPLSWHRTLGEHTHSMADNGTTLRTKRDLLLALTLLGPSLLAQAPTPEAAIAPQQQGHLPEAESAWKAWLKLHPNDAPAF